MSIFERLPGQGRNTCRPGRPEGLCSLRPALWRLLWRFQGATKKAMLMLCCDEWIDGEKKITFPMTMTPSFPQQALDSCLGDYKVIYEIHSKSFHAFFAMVACTSSTKKCFLAHSLCLITAAGSLVVFGAGWMSSSASQSNPWMYFMWVNLSTWRWPPWGYMSYVRILNESHQCESWIGPRSDQGRILWSS